jgi:hypothetical protein
MATAEHALRLLHFSDARSMIEEFLRSVEVKKREAEARTRRPVRPAPIPPTIFSMLGVARFASGDLESVNTAFGSALARVSDPSMRSEIDRARGYGLLLANHPREALPLFEELVARRDDADTRSG